jgi:hypothetical protein
MRRAAAARLARPLLSQPRAGLPPPAELAVLRKRWHDCELDGWHNFLLARGWLRSQRVTLLYHTAVLLCQ